MRKSSRGTLAVVGGCSVISAVAATSSLASGATLLYQWNFDNNGGTGSSVSPAVTPNSLATDGGVLAMEKFGGFAYAPSNLYTAGGGGVSGAAGDYAFDNSASASNNSNPGGIAHSTGAADANNANTVNALPNFTQYTLTMWVKPTAAELTQQSRLMQIATTATFDEPGTTGLWVALNAGKVQTGGSSANSNSNAVGNTLVANAWNFIAVEVDLVASNVFFDTNMQAATGSTLIGATPAQDSFVLYQGDNSSGVYGYTAQNGFANGTMAFSGTQDYLQLLNRTSNATRAFQGQGDDFRIYSGLLTKAELTTLAATAPVPEPASLFGLTAVGSMLLLRRKRGQV